MATPNPVRKHQRLFRRPVKAVPPGSEPGVLVPPPEAGPPVLTVLAFDGEHLEERTVTDVSDIVAARARWPVIWVDLCGLGSVETLRQLGQAFDLHALALEDVLNGHHRPKVEVFDEHLFVIARSPALGDGWLSLDQVSLFIGRDFVLSFRDTADDGFRSVRQRVTQSRQRSRFLHPDYLAYALLDTMVDACFPVLEHYSDRLNALEDGILEMPDRSVMRRVHEIRRDLRVLRQGLWPMRETISRLTADMPLIQDDTRRFLGDCHDHVIHVIDILETYRERASGLTDLHLSAQSTRLNRVMTTLTIITSAFIPPTFVAGVYGMNFDPDVSPYNMPELRWVLGYPFAWAIMIGLAVGFGLYVRHRTRVDGGVEPPRAGKDRQGS